MEVDRADGRRIGSEFADKDKNVNGDIIERQKAAFRGKAAFETGSPGGTRTPDQAVNSRLLYQLSYRGNMERRV